MNEKERREYNEAFGRRVRDYRKNLNMTQAELALKMGYVDGQNPSANISKVEKGQMELTQSKIADLANALDIEPYELFTDSSVNRLVKYAEGIMNMKGGD